MFIEYFQHNLVGTNQCVFTHQALVCNPSYKLVAKFRIKTDKRKFLPNRYNLQNPFWKENGGDIINIKS